MAERSLNTRASVALLRHRWRVLLAAGLVGAVAGVGYAVLVPLELTSTSLVLLPAASQAPIDGGTDVDTQVRLVLSRPVLEEAGRSVRPSLSASQVNDRVNADGATSQLIEIHASSRRPAQAEALAQAVAKAYVSVVTNNAQSVTGATLGELRARETLLRQQLAALQDQIAATSQRKDQEDPRSADARRDAQLLAQLTVDQSDASLQWDQVKKELAAGTAAGLASPAVIVQQASPATGPGALSYLLTCALAGAAAAVALGAAGLLVRERRDPRLRTRDDLADAVGSTVLADVRSRPQRSVAAWSTLFQSYEAPAVDAWAFRQVLRSVAASTGLLIPGRAGARRPGARLEHPRSVTVVCFAGDAQAIALAPQLAAFTASVGVVTRFVAAGGRASAPSLWAACSSGLSSRLRDGLVLDANGEDHDQGAREPAAPPPETLDELLTGLLDRPMDGGKVRAQADAADEDADEDADHVEDSETVEQPAHDDAPVEVDASEGPSGQAQTRALAPEPGTTAGSVLAEHQTQVAPKHVLADLTVVLAIAERRSPNLGRLPSTEVTVLAVSPGAASHEELARLAVALDDAGRRIDGIMIADPDPADVTTGRRTLNERALEPVLPLRTTGVSRLPLAGGERGKGR